MKDFEQWYEESLRKIAWRAGCLRETRLKLLRVKE